MPELIMNFLTGDTVSSSTDYRDALPVNMTAIQREIFGIQGYMQQEPGLTLHATGSGIDRGGIWNSRFNRHYRVSGERLIEVLADGTVNELGTIKGSGNVRMAYSFNNLAIVADKRLYFYNPTDGLRESGDPDTGDPIDVCWVDNYFFYTDGENLYHSRIQDETTIDPLDFATSEFSPDPTYAVRKTVDNRVAVFNRYTTEFFQNNASDNFSFIRIAGLALEVGVIGTHAIAQYQDNFAILGNRKEEQPSFYVVSAGGAKKVATKEIEQIIGEYSETELRGAVLESREEDGYQHVIAHLPRHTLKLNANLGNWSILKSDVAGDDVWRAIHGVFDNGLGKWVYGDKINSNIGILDETSATHYGNLTEWLLFTPFYYLDKASVDQIEIETIPGFTSVNDSTVFCSFVYNGFQTSREVLMDYGGPAEFENRFYKRRMGYVRNYFSVKLRGAARSRVAFSRGVINYG